MKTPKQKQFEEVMNFYRNSTPEQHQIFITLLMDKMTFFNGKDCYDADPEYSPVFNGIFHQIQIKK